MADEVKPTEAPAVQVTPPATPDAVEVLARHLHACWEVAAIGVSTIPWEMATDEERAEMMRRASYLLSVCNVTVK